MSGSHSDPLLAGFARIKIKENLLSSNKGMLMQIGDVILASKRLPRRQEIFQQNGDPVLDKVLTHIKRNRYHISWKRLVVLACSAGGNVALRTIFKHLIVPHIPIIITMHHNPGFTFATQFDTASGIRHAVQTIRDGESILASQVYFLPGDLEIGYHARTSSFQVHKVMGKPRFRPDIDKALATTASRFKKQAVTAIMSGMLNDGAEGVKAVFLNGGEVWIQDPKTAMFKDMPQNAMKNAPHAKIVQLKEIADRINQISQEDLTLEPVGSLFK
jgi:two-component system, chemotaxis family, protein-glutamate methylesterase/glutaminase